MPHSEEALMLEGTHHTTMITGDVQGNVRVYAPLQVFLASAIPA